MSPLIQLNPLAWTQYKKARHAFFTFTEIYCKLQIYNDIKRDLTQYNHETVIRSLQQVEKEWHFILCSSLLDGKSF